MKVGKIVGCLQILHQQRVKEASYLSSLLLAMRKASYLQTRNVTVSYFCTVI
jgi:hypothetical protein